MKNRVYREVKIPRLGEPTLDIFKYFDLDSIPIDKFKEQYIDLDLYIQGSGYDGRMFIRPDGVLSEIVLPSRKTLNTKEVKEDLKRTFNFEDWQFKTTVLANEIKLIVLFVNVENNIDRVILEMKLCGWMFCCYCSMTMDNIPLIATMFDPKHNSSKKLINKNTQNI